MPMMYLASCHVSTLLMQSMLRELHHCSHPGRGRNPMHCLGGLDTLHSWHLDLWANWLGVVQILN